MKKITHRFLKIGGMGRPSVAARALVIGIAISSLAACNSDPLNHPCPTGMTRAQTYICTPNQDASSESLDPLPHHEASTSSGTDSEVVGCPEKAALAQIHEVLIDPDGPDQGREWIELHIDTAGALDGAYVLIRDTLVDEPSMRIALHGRVEKDQRVLIADNHADSIDLGCETWGGCLRNTGGVIQLYDCDDTLLDSVAWGYASARGQAVKSGQSLSWCSRNASWAQSTPTPGDPADLWTRPDACPPPCDPPARLLINEVLYDLVGADGDGEFIELKGIPNTSVSGVTLWAINGYDGKPFLEPIVLDGTTDEDGLYLIGGLDIEARDQTLPGSLQNGPEALYLEDCEDQWLDAMTYGGSAENLAAYGGASPVIPPGQSLGRPPHRADNTDAMGDFVGMIPTPGTINIPNVSETQDSSETADTTPNP